MGLRDSDTVTDAQGTRWLVRRHWHSYRLRWWGPRSLSGMDFLAIDPGDGFGIFIGIMLFFLVVILVFFALPAMLLLLQVAAIAVLFVASMAARLLFGRPWEIEAVAPDGRRRVWLVRGWNESNRAITHIAWALQTGAAVQVPNGREVSGHTK